MRRTLCIARTAVLVLAAGSLPQGAFARAHSVEEAKATAPELKLKRQRPEKLSLDNGIAIYHLEADRLPLVTVRAVVRVGDIWEPSSKSGVADLTGRMLRAGGTSRHSADEVDEEIDFLAAQLFSGIGNEQGSLTLNVLDENLDEALAIFADMLRRPAFEESKIEVQKNIIKEGIRRQNDNPFQIAFREYAKLVWGDDHPRARTPTEESVDALMRQDLVDFHAKFFQPQNIMIGVAGDVSKKKIRQSLEKAFGDWRGRTVEFPDVAAPLPMETRVARAAKDLTQSTVLMGHLGPRETDEHRYSGQVMMEILGGNSFQAYIYDRVRNDEGLAYFALGVMNFGRIDPGICAAFALTKSETTCEATDLILEQIRRIQEEPVTDEDLARARDGFLNAAAFDYDSTEEIVENLMDLIYYGLPEDHLERGLEEVAKVDKAAVQAAARALLHPDALTLFAVGNPETMDCGWETYAEERGVDLREIVLE